MDLPVSERLHLIEMLLDSIDPNELPMPESHKRALDEALSDYKRNPDEGRPWDEVRDELFPTR